MLFLSGSPESLKYSSGKVIHPCLLLYEHYHKINKAMGSDALTKDWVDITLVPALWRYVPQDINGDETVFFYKTTPHCTHCMGEEKPFGLQSTKIDQNDNVGGTLIWIQLPFI